MPKRVQNRPPIEACGTGAELRRWYWLKSELEDRTAVLGLRASGGKFTILDRVAHYRALSRHRRDNLARRQARHAKIDLRLAQC
jgi:hypothetical protein